MNRLEQIFEQSASPAQFAQDYLEYLGRLLKQVDVHALEQVVEAFLSTRSQDGQIVFLGNGGSAATASHFANDLAICVRAGAPPFRAWSCTDNVPAITSIANDLSYDDVFFKQLEHRIGPQDLVVAISASGSSENILKAVRYAVSCDTPVVALTGFDGGPLKTLATIALHVPTAAGEYGPVEDLHLVFDHIIANYLMMRCRAER